MHAIESLVPDFDRALARMPGAAPAWRVLTQSTQEGELPDRASALVRLAVAQHAGGEYARWAVARLAAKEGMSSEDIFLATIGTAREAKQLGTGAVAAGDSPVEEFERASGPSCFGEGSRDRRPLRPAYSRPPPRS